MWSSKVSNREGIKTESFSFRSECLSIHPSILLSIHSLELLITTRASKLSTKPTTKAMREEGSMMSVAASKS